MTPDAADLVRQSVARPSRWMRGQIDCARWLRSVTELWGGACGDNLVDGYELAVEILGTESASDNSTGVAAFAYLWRRFGPPRWPSDEIKDLAAYVLRTPDPEVQLVLRPSGSAIAPCVGYRAPDRLRNHWALGAGESSPPPDPGPRVHAALRAALTDLLRPVWVRDVPINLLGEGGVGRKAPVSRYAGRAATPRRAS